MQKSWKPGTLRFVFQESDFDKNKAYKAEKQGKLKSLGRGIYVVVDPEKPFSAEELLNICAQNILKIAAYRYADARLFGQSALQAMHGTSALLQGQLHLASTSVQGRRVRELVPGLVDVVLHPDSDSLFLKGSKRYRVQLAEGRWGNLWFPEPAQVVQDLLANIDPYGQSPVAPEYAALIGALSDQEKSVLSAIAKQKGIPFGKPLGPVALLPERMRLDMFLQDRLWGQLVDRGIAWHIETRSDMPGFPVADLQTQFFLESLFPETEDQKTERITEFLQHPRRLMNLTICPQGTPVCAVENRIQESLSVYRRNDGLYLGSFCFPDDAYLEAEHPAEPKLSGFQPKFPAFINRDGDVQFSTDRDPFTVIAKMDYGFDPKRFGLPVLEWACQQISRYAGVETPETALLVHPDGQRAIFLSERFDVPVRHETRDFLALDGTALLGLSADNKYQVDPLQLWKRIESIASSETIDADRQSLASAFFDRFALAYVLADGDLHAKNLSVVFSKTPRDDRWSLRLSPAYDTVCTRALSGLERDRMALKILGKDDGLTPEDWDRFAQKLGVSHGAERVQSMAAKAAQGFSSLAQIHTARLLLEGDYAGSVSRMFDRAAEIVHRRAMELGVAETDMPACSWEDVLDNGAKSALPAESDAQTEPQPSVALSI